MTSARVEEARRRKEQQLGRLHAAYNVARDDLRSKARLAGLVHVHGMWRTYRAVLGPKLWGEMRVTTPPELRSTVVANVAGDGYVSRSLRVDRNGPIERWLPGWVVLTIEAWRRGSSLVGDARSIRKFIKRVRVHAARQLVSEAADAETRLVGGGRLTAMYCPTFAGMPSAISAAQELDGSKAVVELIEGVGGFG